MLDMLRRCIDVLCSYLGAATSLQPIDAHTEAVDVSMPDQ